ncbi:hypothetical protein SteCoe_14873 [Stentor coeruleus]|uniref:Importin N-terminal domain-containing protein n=1 Tax=Stentor coeruleus TaxID=5963 RepID=A0A1R2C4V7_9CILI|nr:hypothetical protein SteCoe_14873 [Stentor coeruleus]
MEEFESSLALILSNNNKLREQGENFISTLSNNPDFYKYLLYGLSLPLDQSCLSSIIFRQMFIDTGRFVKLSPSVQLEIKDYLLSNLVPEKDWRFIKSIGFLITKVLQNLGNYEEIINIVELCKSNQRMAKLAIYIVEVIAQNWPSCVEKYGNRLNSAMWELLDNNDSEIRILSGKSICELSLITRNLHPDVQEKILSLASLYTEHPSLSVLLQLLCNVIKKIELQNCESISKVMITISSNKKNPSENRITAVEVLLLLPLKEFSQNQLHELLALSFSLMAEINYYNDLQTWSEEIQEIKLINNEPYTLGEDLLRLLCKIRSLYESILKLVDAHLNAAHWVHQHVGIIAYGLLSLVNKKALSGFSTITQYFCSQNPRLVWAALRIASVLFLKEAPSLQCIGGMLNLIVHSMNSNVKKVQYQCFIALEAYYQGLIMKNAQCQENIHEMVLKVYQVLGNPQLNHEVMVEVLTFLAILAETMQAEFGVYSDKFVSGLKNLIFSNMPNHIKTSALACLSCVVDSIGNTALCQTVLVEILQLLGSDDAIDNAIIENAPHFFYCLKSNFYQFSSIIMPILYKNALTTVDVHTSKSEAKPGKIIVIASFEMKGSEGHEMIVCTDDLNKKLIAMKSLMMMSIVGNDFIPFIFDAINISSQLINYKYNKDIRSYAIKILKHILKIPSTITQVINPIMKSIFSCLVEPINSKHLINILHLLYIALEKSYEIEFLTLDQAEKMCQVISLQMANEINKIKNQSESPNSEVFVKIAKVNEKLLKKFKNSLCPVFRTNFKPLCEELLLIETIYDKEIIAIQGMLCDYIEFTNDFMCENESFPFLGLSIKLAQHLNSTVRHNASYAIGLYAQSQSEVFKKYVDYSVEALNSILIHPQSKDLLIEVSECAVEALAWISVYYRCDLILTWVEWLPFKCLASDTQKIKNLIANNLGTLQRYAPNVDFIGIMSK